MHPVEKACSSLVRVETVLPCVLQVAATTLDDVWYPLIKKKGLNKKPVAAEASASSDLSARYRLVPRSNQVAQAAEVSIFGAIALLLVVDKLKSHAAVGGGSFGLKMF